MVRENKNENSKKSRGKRKRRNRVKWVLSVIIIGGILFASSFMAGQYASIQYRKMYTIKEEAKPVVSVSTPVTKVNETKEEEKNLNIDKENTKEIPAEEQKNTEKEAVSEENNGKYTEEEAVPVQNIYKSDGKKVAFLTFDDGPTTSITPKILKILKRENIKATFFVLGSLAQENPEMIKEEVKEGNRVANHSYSHQYNYIYKNQKNFLEEVDKTEKVIKKILGDDYDAKLFRFPGGSFEKSKEPYKEVLKNKGYEYIDWNGLNGDAEGKNISAESLIKRVKETVSGKEHVVILMHDAGGKETTVQALPQIIQYLKAEGYQFKLLK